MRRIAAVTIILLAGCSQAVLPRQDAALQPPPPAPAPVFLPQGWSNASRLAFDTTPQGSHIMPLAWFQALQRPDSDAPFAADQLQRYGYLASDATPGAATPLPVGFVRDSPDANPQLGMTCAACHTGQLRARGITWRIDGGRANADFQSFLVDLGLAVQRTLGEPVRFTAFSKAVLGPDATQAQIDGLHDEAGAWLAKYQAFMTASLPDPAWGPGRLDAFGMIFNRMTGLDLAKPANYAKAEAPVRYPFIWDAPRQDHTQWTGAAPNGTYLRGLARNSGEVFGVFGVLNNTPPATPGDVYANSISLRGLQSLEQMLVALRPPPWPEATFPLDAQKVSRGAVIFQAQCAGCHGARPSPSVLKAWQTPVVAVQTDSRTFVNANALGDPGVLTGRPDAVLTGPALTDPNAKLGMLLNAVTGTLLAPNNTGVVIDAVNHDIVEGRLPRLIPAPKPLAISRNVASATKELYKLPVQAPSATPGAAYEARVLTGIWAVGPYLHNGSVASLAELLKPASARLTSFAVGHQDFDPVSVGLETDAKPGRAMFAVDPTNGNGNGGHEYGTTLADPDKWALVEYLKTL